MRHKHCVGLYNIEAVCCNGHMRENMLSSNRFTSIQGKTISSLSEFRVSLQNFRVSFWHPKTAYENTVLANGDIEKKLEKLRTVA